MTCKSLDVCVHAKSLWSCPTLCDPMDCSPPGSSVHGIFQARILEWVVMPSSRGSSYPRDWTRVSYVFLFYACFLKVHLHCLWALIISVKSVISLMIVALEIMCLIGCLFLCFSDVLLWCIHLGVIFLFILLGAPWIYRLMCFFSVLDHSWLFCFTSALLCLSLPSGNPVTCVLDFLFMSHVSFVLLSVFSILYFLS